MRIWPTRRPRGETGGYNPRSPLPQPTVSKRVLGLTRDTPFLVTSVVVGNIQYPEEVANAVAAKMAATQVLERKQTEIAIEEREKQKRKRP